MGILLVQFETFPQTTPIFIDPSTPIKREAEVLRSIQELISMQLLTQQMITQLAGGKLQTNQAFIRQGQRADEGAAFDDSVQQVRLLSQRVEELEKRLDEASGKKSTAAGK